MLAHSKVDLLTYVVTSSHMFQSPLSEFFAPKVYNKMEKMKHQRQRSVGVLEYAQKDAQTHTYPSHSASFQQV